MEIRHSTICFDVLYARGNRESIRGAGIRYLTRSFDGLYALAATSLFGERGFVTQQSPPIDCMSVLVRTLVEE